MTNTEALEAYLTWAHGPEPDDPTVQFPDYPHVGVLRVRGHLEEDGEVVE